MGDVYSNEDVDLQEREAVAVDSVIKASAIGDGAGYSQNPTHFPLKPNMLGQLGEGVSGLNELDSLTCFLSPVAIGETIGGL